MLPDPHNAQTPGRANGASLDFSINLGLSLLFGLWIVTPVVPNQPGPGSTKYELNAQGNYVIGTNLFLLYFNSRSSQQEDSEK